ncbi:MAG TPA: dihydrolipoamide acetyltransferase family protein [Bdellovibrionota bacterium]|jgi:pyruvate dehydrogenase E2 component (dihydrolipoamide acetyltransferase)|nr:dihydrolipoamide acetyltransferase family protein [Bdellovibrionota bacterium]
MANFELPEIGEGVNEGELIQWKVKVGDSIKADEPIMEVMTDKATVEVPSPFTGVVKELKFKEGDMVPVGAVAAVIEEGAGAAKVEAPKAEAPKAAAPAAPAPVAAAPKEEAKAPSQGATSAPATATSNYKSATEELSASDIPAAPIVRKMARDAGVSLSSVTGTGESVGGKARVLEEDLLKYINSGAGAAKGLTPSFAQVAGQELEERKPIRGLRRVIAQAMTKSKFTAPHFSYVDEFECSALVALREEAKKIADKEGVKFSYLPFIVKALVGALKEFPQANASLEEKDGKMELVLKKYYHIGIAVATDDGLIVPVIKHADQKSLLQIAAEINDLSARTRAGKASADELKGSTFTITSMGNIGGLFATPIINYPEVGIMGVYKIQEKPIVKNGQIVVGKTMHLSLSLDHRVVDGAVGGYFCNAVIERLQNPARLLLDLK